MKKKILIVEDELDLRELLTGFLEHKGFEVLQAENGKKAIAIIDDMGYPDLVLTDLIMDEMEGVELIRILMGKNSELKIIAMSGGGRIGPDNYLKIAKVLGVACILKKPFKLEDLFILIEKHI